MKLMYDMPQADRQAYDAAVSADEKLMYCIPFNIIEDRFVSGWMAFTTQKIYKILDGQVLNAKPSCTYAHYHAAIKPKPKKVEKKEEK